MTSKDDHDEDISVELANYTEPTLTTALMIRRRLDQENVKGFNNENFKITFPKPRKLDIGCGNVSESGWIRLDCDEKCKPHLLMDAQNLLIEQEAIHEGGLRRGGGLVAEALESQQDRGCPRSQPDAEDRAVSLRQGR